MADAELYVVEMPMRRPFGHSRATRRASENLVFRLSAGGFEGLGESLPREYVTGETVPGAFDAVTSVDVDELANAASAGDFREALRRVEALELSHRMARGGRQGLAAACTIELALLDIVGKKFDRPLRDAAVAIGIEPGLTSYKGGRYAGTKVCDLTKSPEEFAADLTGVPRHIKVKSGAGRAEDVARIRRLRERFPRSTFSLDANMEWSVDEAVTRITELRPFDVAWYEEPIAQGDLAGCAEIRRRTAARVMLDESLCSFEDGVRAVEAEACDLFNIRISKCGGFLRSLRLAELAFRNDKSIQVGAQVGQMGILGAASRQLMGSIGPVVSYEGADIRALFAERVTREPVEADDDYLCDDLPGSGLGVTLDRPVLERYVTRAARWTSTGWS